MIIGVISDTHNDRANAIPHIIRQFKKRGVEMIVHCGDIIPKHVSNELFGNLPVICALVDGQDNDPVFDGQRPSGWEFTRPNKRIVKLPDGTCIYVGHKRHSDFLRATEEEFSATLTDLRKANDGLRIVFGGHLHFQTFKQGQLVSFINPGAVEDALGWGYEYAIVDSITEEAVFSRVLPTKDNRETFSVGVISDSLDISHRDTKYWSCLADEFSKRDVSHIIHCGNLSLKDIARKELDKFTIHYAIRSDQRREHEKLVAASLIPDNWQVISLENLDEGAVVDINEYRFYVQLDLGLKFMTVSELGMDSIAMQIRRKHPETEFLLCGFTREALFVEGQQVITINPGDVNADRSFAVICLPRREITFGHVPHDALPPIEKE
ncbi:MAG: metallophosphoesterase family protein [Candidatus Paceibacterota bacterium]|jgi:putative phosphoesterase